MGTGTGPDAEVPEVLHAAAVMARYGLRDRRSARRVMDAAGAFVVGGRLLVRAQDLSEHEERLLDERRGAAGRSRQSLSPRAERRPRRAPKPRSREPLAPGWWRQA